MIDPAFSPCGGSVGFDIVNKACWELRPAGSDELDKFTVSVGQLGLGTPTSLVIQPSTTDAWVTSAAQTTNYGTGATMNVQGRAVNVQRSLLKFDLSGIPAGATINSATLELYASSVLTTGQTLDVHRITGTWTETGVTWATLPTFTATADASVAGGTAIGWKVGNVLPVVQGWQSGTNANDGFLVKNNPETGSVASIYSFATRENGTAVDKPILRVNYTPANVWDCSYVGSGICASPCTPPSAPSITSVTDAAPCTMSGIQIVFTPGAPGSRHDLYKDGTLATTGYTSGAIYLPGDTASHNYVVRAINGADNCFADSTQQAGTDATCAAVPPEVGPGNTLANSLHWVGSSLTWPVEPTATGYKLYRGVKADLPNLITTSVNSCTRYTGVSTTSPAITEDPSAAAGLFYWYLVIGSNATGDGTAGNGRTIHTSGPCLQEGRTGPSSCPTAPRDLTTEVRRTRRKIKKMFLAKAQSSPRRE